MKLKTSDYFIVILVLATAVLHFAAAFDRLLFPDGTPDPLFTLNGLGYLGLLGAFYLPIPFFQQRHKLVWQILFGYVILTIVAWLVIWVGHECDRTRCAVLQPRFNLWCPCQNHRTGFALSALARETLTNGRGGKIRYAPQDHLLHRAEAGRTPRRAAVGSRRGRSSGRDHLFRNQRGNGDDDLSRTISK